MNSKKKLTLPPPPQKKKKQQKPTKNKTGLYADLDLSVNSVRLIASVCISNFHLSRYGEPLPLTMLDSRINIPFP